MSANRKERRNVSFEPVHSVSVRGHRHQASDSGVGSDHDSYSTSPDRSAQAYYDLRKAHLSLKDEHAKLQEEYRSINARVGALQNSIDVLEDNQQKLLREKRTLKDENDKLREDLRKARGSTREPKMTGALPPQSQTTPPKEKTRRSESKVRRSSDEKEREKRHKEDKERLKSRFDHKEKDDKSNSSTTSSGRSRRESYVEPYGPSAARNAVPVVETVHRPRSKRSDSSYSQMRPQVQVSTTMPDPGYSAVPRTPAHTDYDSAVFDDASVYTDEDGNYHAYPLQSEASSRGRPSHW